MPKGRSCTLRKQGFNSAQRQVTANSGTQAAALLRMDRCGSFHCYPHSTSSLTSEQTLKDLIRSQGHIHIYITYDSFLIENVNDFSFLSYIIIISWRLVSITKIIIIRSTVNIFILCEGFEIREIKRIREHFRIRIGYNLRFVPTLL